MGLSGLMFLPPGLTLVFFKLFEDFCALQMDLKIIFNQGRFGLESPLLSSSASKPLFNTFYVKNEATFDQQSVRFFVQPVCQRNFPPNARMPTVPSENMFFQGAAVPKIIQTLKTNNGKTEANNMTPRNLFLK